MRVNNRLRLRFSIGYIALFELSVTLFALIYLLPVSIQLPNMVRSLLQMLSVGCLFLLLLCKRRKYILFLLSMIGIVLVYYHLSWSKTTWSLSSYLATATVSFVMMISSFLVLEGTATISKRVLNLVEILLCITAITTIFGLIKNPLAVRTLGQSSDSANELKTFYRQKNIAGWELLFGMAFSQGPLTYLWRRDRKIHHIVVIIITEIAIVMSQLGMAIIISASLVFLVLVLGKNYRYVRRMALIFCLFVILWLFRASILGALLNLADKSGLYFVKLRAQNLYDLIIRHSTEGDAGSRFLLYGRSLSSFIRYPFSLFFSEGGSISKYLGFHSEFFDILGAMGLFGLAWIVFLWSYVIHFIIKKSQMPDTVFLMIMCLFFLMFWILNPVLYSPPIWFAALLYPAAIIKTNGYFY